MWFFRHRKTDRGSFVKEVLRTLSRAGVTDAVYDESSFRISAGGSYYFLSNAYHEYCGAKRRHRQGVLNQYYGGAAQPAPETPADWDAVRERVLPVVRSPDYYECVRIQAVIDGQETAFGPMGVIADCVAFDVAVDSDSMISLLGREQLAEWQRTPAEALEQAMSNLRRKSDKPMQELQPGLYISDWDDSYESSRLLVPDVLHRARLKGELVAMAPVRDVLMITGHKDLEGLAMMAHAAADCMKEGRWVTFQMLRHREGAWERFIPEGPAGDELRRLQVDERASSYDQQKELLDRLHEKTATDVFVARLMVMEAEDTGDRLSLCCWTEDVESLLPITDLISFVRPTAESPAASEEPQLENILVRWSVAVEACGELMVREPQLWPPRYRVKGFPSDEQWQVLKERAEAEAAPDGA